jgi:hypothetical protein
MNLDALYSLVGDIPVSEQIMTAIAHHTHSDCATKDEVEDLRKKIELLLTLVGDMSVSEQIAMAFKNIK